MLLLKVFNLSASEALFGGVRLKGFRWILFDNPIIGLLNFSCFVCF